MEQVKQAGVPTFIGVASVWIGTHFGPGTASGAQMVRYYVSHGAWGLVMPIVAMTLLGFAIYFSMEYVRLNQLTQFGDFVRGVYAPYDKIALPFVDFAFLFTVTMSAGASLAASGSLYQTYMGIPYWIAIAIMLVVIIMLCIFGADLVRKVSAYMMYFMVGIMVLVAIASFVWGDFDLAGAFANNAKNATQSPGFSAALWSAIIYASFQAGNICNIVPVSAALESKKEAKKAAVAGILLNSLLLCVGALMLFSYTNVYDVTKQTLPIFSVFQRLGMPWLTFVYVVLMTLAIVSTGVGQIFAVITRWDKYLVRAIGNEKARRITIGTVMLVFCACAASFGLLAIVSTGFTILGYLNLPILLLPAYFVTSYKIGNRYRAKSGGTSSGDR